MKPEERIKTSQNFRQLKRTINLVMLFTNSTFYERGKSRDLQNMRSIPTCCCRHNVYSGRYWYSWWGCGIPTTVNCGCFCSPFTSNYRYRGSITRPVAVGNIGCRPFSTTKCTTKCCGSIIRIISNGRQFFFFFLLCLFWLPVEEQIHHNIPLVSRSNSSTHLLNHSC
nr:hypothetical protein Iba_chr09eCG6560 [Ipomoea batatas]